LTPGSGRKARIAIAIVALVAAQLAAWWVYRRVEHAKVASATSVGLEYERVQGEQPEPDALLQRPDGTTVTLLAHYGEPLLVHFWATWCGPCRSELPKLVQLGREGKVRVLLVSVDEGWSVVRHFFQGELPGEVVLDASGAVRHAFDVSSLPDTYLVNGNGKPTARFRGPRDWTGRSARDEFDELLREAKADSLAR
jgi:thiol-disulfide isomerase/thioredoxin